MSIEANRALATRYLDCTSRGDIDAAFALVADDVEWLVPGRSPMSGKFSKAYVRNAVEGLIAMTKDGLRIWPTGMTAEGDRVAIQAESRAELTNGQIYENQYHLLLVIRDGKIRQAYEYLDTAYAMQMLADVLPATDV